MKDLTNIEEGYGYEETVRACSVKCLHVFTGGVR